MFWIFWIFFDLLIILVLLNRFFFSHNTIQKFESKLVLTRLFLFLCLHLNLTVSNAHHVIDFYVLLYLRNRTWITRVWHNLTIINLCWWNRWGLQFVHFEFEISRHFLGYPGFLIRGYPSHRGPIFENVPSCQG